MCCVEMLRAVNKISISSDIKEIICGKEGAFGARKIQRNVAIVWPGLKAPASSTQHVATRSNNVAMLWHFL